MSRHTPGVLRGRAGEQDHDGVKVGLARSPTQQLG